MPSLTVAQNVFLGIENNKNGFLCNDEEIRLKSIYQLCGFSLNPNVLAGDIGIADQQKIEIMRALARDSNVIIMDEPTSSLSANEIEKLHQTMAKLRDANKTVIYVSHFLDDILDICDRVTIIREGKHVRTTNIADETKATLIQGMLGSDSIEVSYPELPVAPSCSKDPLLFVQNLCSEKGVKGVDLRIEAGEIVGLLGLVGSGRTEIANAIFGVDPSTADNFIFNGQNHRGASPENSIERGLSMVPEDRRSSGLVLSQDVLANISLPHLKIFSKLGFINRKVETQRVKELVNFFEISPKKLDGNILNYSGGNQQKILLYTPHSKTRKS